MIDALLSGSLAVFTPSVLGIIILGVLIGLAVGILPGIGGITTIAILLPFIYRLSPTSAISFILAIYAATATSGIVTTILLGIPGEASASADLLDGLPMTRQGKADRAMAAGFAASLLGGIFGACVLAALIPVVTPIVMSCGSPELFALALLGISFIALLSKGNTLRGLFMGLLGILTAFVGVASYTGTPRFTFGLLSLYDGIPLTAIAIGIFAIPELIDMMISGSIVREGEDIAKESHGIREGITDCFRHWRTLLSCSALGVIIGIIPGVGAMTAIFLAYGLARQLSKRPHEFGKGCVEGIIGPESSDNAKEGGALLTTLAFGVPGSAGMAMVLIVLMMAGIAPGAELMTKHLDLVWSCVVAIVVSNIISAGICIVSARQLAKIVYIKLNFLAPIILLLVLVGAYGTNQRIEDVLFAFFVGGMGYLFKRLGFSRIPFIVGFVLGDLVERYFLLSLGTRGPAFLFKSPIALGFLLVLIPVMLREWLKSLYGRLLRKGRGA